MNRKIISPSELQLNLFDTTFKRGALFCVGDANKSNLMTISWGFSGVIWNKPIFVALVRPTRYSHQFLEKIKSFSVNFMSSRYSEQTAFCGTRTGSQVDKWKQCGLSPIPGKCIATPVIDEAELILECRIIHEQNLDTAGFLAKEIENHYPKQDYHQIYFGQIEHIEGIEDYAN
jgi:flavin reductase (DIM6/NTAB) family NADH-FMN oxidoreductase RutF